MVFAAGGQKEHWAHLRMSNHSSKVDTRVQHAKKQERNGAQYHARSVREAALLRSSILGSHDIHGSLYSLRLLSG
jgi:hypothetical protein